MHKRYIAITAEPDDRTMYRFPYTLKAFLGDSLISRISNTVEDVTTQVRFHFKELGQVAAKKDNNYRSIILRPSLKQRVSASMKEGRPNALRHPEHQPQKRKTDRGDFSTDSVPLPRQCHTPLDNAIPTVPRFTIPNAQEYADELIYGITAARNSAQTHLGIAHSLYNKPKVVHTLLREIPVVLNGVRSKPMRRVRQFEVGEQVLIMWVPVILKSNTTKLTKMWRGPFTVTDKIGLLTYKVRLGNRKPRVVNVNRLKAHYPASRWK
eukprot:gene8427-biopygen4061